MQAGIKLPARGQQDSIWLNGLALAKGSYRVMYKNGQLNKSFSVLPPTVLLVERAALVEHMILEIERLEPDRFLLDKPETMDVNTPSMASKKIAETSLTPFGEAIASCQRTAHSAMYSHHPNSPACSFRCR